MYRIDNTQVASLQTHFIRGYYDAASILCGRMDKMTIEYRTGVAMSVWRPKGSKVYWYDFVFEGRRIRESTKTTSKTLAKQAENARKLGLAAGFNNITHRSRPQLFSEAAAEYLTAKQGNIADSSLQIEQRNVDRLLPIFGRMLLKEITLEDIKAYRVKR